MRKQLQKVSAILSTLEECVSRETTYGGELLEIVTDRTWFFFKIKWTPDMNINSVSEEIIYSQT